MQNLVKARVDGPTTYFLFHLLVAATRGFEGYDTFVNFRNQVIKYFRTDPLKDNRKSMKALSDYINHPPYILEFNNPKVFDSAKKIFISKNWCYQI